MPTLKLNRRGKQALMLPVTGQGGWQSLMRRLQAQRRGDVLHLNATDMHRLLAIAAPENGSGGWQGRVRTILGKEP